MAAIAHDIIAYLASHDSSLTVADLLGSYYATSQWDNSTNPTLRSLEERDKRKCAEQFADILIHALDENEDGKISLEEWEAFDWVHLLDRVVEAGKDLRPLEEALQEKTLVKNLKKIFDAYDKDHNGKLEGEELTGFVQDCFNLVAGKEYPELHPSDFEELSRDFLVTIGAKGKKKKRVTWKQFKAHAPQAIDLHVQQKKSNATIQREIEEQKRQEEEAKKKEEEEKKRQEEEAKKKEEEVARGKEKWVATLAAWKGRVEEKISSFQDENLKQLVWCKDTGRGTLTSLAGIIPLRS